MAIDPVCKMNVEPEKAAAKAEHVGQVYYFCSDTCHKTFTADPEKYTSGTAPADHSCCGGHK
ncbi:MAG: YHS domain-containing protein [Thiobacillus sp.]